MLQLACIPIKTLLRPVEVRGEAERAAGVNEPSLDWPELSKYRDYMTSAGDDSAQVAGYPAGCRAWIHQAGLAIRAEIPINVLRDTVAQFPSYSEGYPTALAQLEL